MAPVSLHIVAADEIMEAEVLLNMADVVEAVLASTAIPAVFTPVRINGRNLLDRVIATGTPISTAFRLGARRLILPPCGFTFAEKAIPRHAVDRAMHAMTLLGARQLAQDFENYVDRVTLRVIPLVCPLKYSSYDNSHGDSLIYLARIHASMARQSRSAVQGFSAAAPCSYA